METRRVLGQAAVERVRPRHIAVRTLSGILAALFLLAGCAHQVDHMAADLMPAKAAQQIFVSNGFGAWLARPYLVKEGMFCESGRVNVAFQDIDRATYSVLWQRLTLFRSSESTGSRMCGQLILFDVNKETAYELVKAARALGARIDSVLIVSRPPPIERFATRPSDIYLTEVNLLVDPYLLQRYGDAS